MSNHVHLIAVPESEAGLARAIGEAHRRYTRMVNFREQWRGHLWKERFASFPMDESHALAAVRYVETNPVAAHLVERPEDYAWSSARAHFTAKNDCLVKDQQMLALWSHDFFRDVAHRVQVVTLGDTSGSAPLVPRSR